MDIIGNKVEAIFQKRLNRFVARVMLQGKSIDVHVPNSGRLAELFIPGARVILRDSDNPSRKYRFDLIMVYHNDILVSVDSILPNKLLVEEFKRKTSLLKSNGKIQKLLEYSYIKPEIKYEDSRFDMGLGEFEEIKYYIEIKGVTLVENRLALFPDAPTLRGTKHLLGLSKAKAKGYGAGVFFIIQRQDADVFTPNDEMDQEFGKALRYAQDVGVDIFAYKCQVSPNKINLIKQLKVKL